MRRCLGGGSDIQGLRGGCDESTLRKVLFGEAMEKRILNEFRGDRCNRCGVWEKVFSFLGRGLMVGCVVGRFCGIFVLKIKKSRIWAPRVAPDLHLWRGKHIALDSGMERRQGMAAVTLFTCVCGVQKKTSNHWVLAKMTKNGITFMPWDWNLAVSNDIIVLCGEGCASALLSRSLGEWKRSVQPVASAV